MQMARREKRARQSPVNTTSDMTLRLQDRDIVADRRALVSAARRWSMAECNSLTSLLVSSRSVYLPG